MSVLKNPSTEGDSYDFSSEPEIWPGVHGIWFDRPDGIYFAMVMAKVRGNGDVGRMLDALPRERKVVFTNVMSPILMGMLERRGFVQKQVWLYDPEMDDSDLTEAMVREP